MLRMQIGKLISIIMTVQQQLLQQHLQQQQQRLQQQQLKMMPGEFKNQRKNCIIEFKW